MLHAQFAQARRAHFLAHFNQIFGVEAERAAQFQYAFQGLQIDQMLALVVDHATAIPAVADFFQLPRRQAFVPVFVETSDDIAMAITENGGQALCLEPLGKQKRPLGSGMGHDLAGKAHAFKQRDHFGGNIAGQFIGPLGVLALGRDRHKAGQIGFHQS